MRICKAEHAGERRTNWAKRRERGEQMIILFFPRTPINNAGANPLSGPALSHSRRCMYTVFVGSSCWNVTANVRRQMTHAHLA